MQGVDLMLFRFFFNFKQKILTFTKDLSRWNKRQTFTAGGHGKRPKWWLISLIANFLWAHMKNILVNHFNNDNFRETYCFQVFSPRHWLECSGKHPWFQSLAMFHGRLTARLLIYNAIELFSNFVKLDSFIYIYCMLSFVVSETVSVKVLSVPAA